MNYEILGMLTSAGVVIVSFYLTIYRGQKQEWVRTAEQRQKSIQALSDLTKEVVKLSTTLAHVNLELGRQDNRVSKHGKEIDTIRESSIAHEERIENHEHRISKLEDNK
ncbi:MAG: hypothetical protein ACK5KR_08900 [Breznakia sp.]